MTQADLRLGEDRGWKEENTGTKGLEQTLSGKGQIVYFQAAWATAFLRQLPTSTPWSVKAARSDL